MLKLIGLALVCSTFSFADIFTFSSIDFPGEETWAEGINGRGQIVGVARGTGDDHGFLYSGGTFTSIVSSPSSWGTQVYKINDSGQIVGRNLGTLQGFVYSAGTFTSLAPLVAFGLNNAGTFVGGEVNDPHGFIQAGGALSIIDFPGASNTTLHGINDYGQIVGQYLNFGVPPIHGFLDDGGLFTPLDYPGAINTWAMGINDLGQIVGSYDSPSTGNFYTNNSRHGFLYSGGAYTSIDFPWAVFTEANGLSDSGQIVGNYTDSQGVRHGFLATAAVPEPTGLILFLLPLGLTIARLKLKHQT